MAGATLYYTTTAGEGQPQSTPVSSIGGYRSSICLPWLKWLHKFYDDSQFPYENDMLDRVQNYIIGFDELGVDKRQLEDHFGVSLYQIAKENMEK